MEAYGHLYFQRVAGYEYLYKYYYIKLLCYCFIFCINNNTDKEHLKFNPCEYSSLSDYLIFRLRYFLDDFVCHIPAKIPCTFTYFIIFGKNTKKVFLRAKFYLTFLILEVTRVFLELWVNSSWPPTRFQRGGGGGGPREPGSTCFCSSLPPTAQSLLSLCCLLFLPVQRVFATRTPAPKEILGAWASLRLKESFQPWLWK